MAKAIITIDDSNNGFDISVAFDPPMPESQEERAKTPAPPAAQLASQVMMFLRSILEEPEGEADGKQIQQTT